MANDPTAGDVAPYGYTPTRSVCIIFIVLYTISTLVHIGEAVIFSGKRQWWLFPTLVLGGILEIVGWGARLWSSGDMQSSLAFLIQIVALLNGPTPLLAVVFIIFARVIGKVGSRYSRLSPKNYGRIFLTLDLSALTVQGVGGGLANSSNISTSQLGGKIMLAGVCLQLVSITIFAVLIGEFFYRYLSDQPVHSAKTAYASLNASTYISNRLPVPFRLQLMIWASLAATLFLFIRAIYRTAELSHGFGSAIMSKQYLFNILDGGMITLTIYTFNFFHPGVLLRSEDVDWNDSLQVEKAQQGVPVDAPPRGSQEELLQY